VRACRYAYDERGNMIGRSDGAKLTFDGQNRLIRYQKGDVDAVYAYDPNGRRKSKTVNGLVTEHVWKNDKITVDIIGGHMVKYAQRQESSGDPAYGLRGYDPFGVPLASATPDVPYRGEYCDEETGYIYLRARYYDPSIGRFVSADSAFDGDNWYIYCGNDPVNFVDPTGLKRVPDHIIKAILKHVMPNLTHNGRLISVCRKPL